MSHAYRVHGKFWVRAVGQVLHSEVVGPFNRELYLAWSAQAVPLLRERCTLGPTASIVHFEGSVLTQPEALERLYQATEVAVAQFNLRAIAFVVPPEVEGAFLAAGIYGPLHAGLVPFRVFEAEPPAWQWVSSVLEG